MRTRWTAEEDALLVAFAESGTPWTEVARQMGRTRPSIVGRAAALGLRGQRPPRWTARDLHDLDSMLDNGWSDERIARRLGRTPVAIRIMMKKRGMASRSRRLMSALRVAEMLGVGCAKTIVRWITNGWLRGRQGPARGMHRQWQVTEEDVWAFIESPAHWHLFNPERIPDQHLREWAIEIRDGVRFLTPGQVAWRLYTTDASVNDWIHKGLLPAVRNGNWLIRESDVEAFVPPSQKPKPAPTSRFTSRSANRTSAWWRGACRPPPAAAPRPKRTPDA
mgnify:CR=1 FL=1